MAAGDVLLYDKYLRAKESASESGLSGLPVDLAVDTLKLAVMDDVFVPDPDETTTQNHWADISANQVATGTGYTGPITLANVATALAAGVTTVNCDNVTIPQDATGFTNGRRLVVYKDTGVAATSPLLAVLDLGANKSIQAGSQTFNFSSGLWTVGKSPAS